ncbi:hypothetical protein NQ318_014940 [Aromia moschata]|uniref:Uncharacterized protein n=1 Tax=Aromia moschata TaxID=1265417 RepID=A0AAV8XBD7_9CUCU|nr:hypothetical protein NQ318_014940 [Aromia moschata]
MYTTGLADERVRWINTIASIEANVVNVTGDILICSGCVAYLTPFTDHLYSNVCRSLFERNKLHFAFLLCVRILINAGKLDPHEWHYFLAGGSPTKIAEK